MSTTSPPPGSGGPEYLEPEAGEPVRSGSGAGGGGRRAALVGGGAVVALAAVGGGVWAAMSFFATGPQPAEALPASTVGYASVDLDPSGAQKIEAMRMIEKFPALKKELDGLDADDDLVAKLFEQVEKDCEGVSYADDVKPWLGHRFAVAAVDLGEQAPAPVGVVQVSDASAAEDGLGTLQECGGADVGGWVVDGDWAVIAETDDIAQQVVDATADGSLADDGTFQEWTDELGEAGVVNFYAAPEAGRHLAGLVDDFGAFGPMGAMPGDDLDSMGLTTDDPEAMPAVPEEMAKALEGFEGAAATLRFDDGALELEMAVGPGEEALAAYGAADGRAEAVTSLPADTAAALGMAVPEGWVDFALEQVASMEGSGMTRDQMAEELEAATGLTVDDLETLLGESFAIALGSDLDPETLFSSSDGSDIPVGAKIQGDADAIQDVLERLSGNLGPGAAILAHDADGDYVAVGPNQAYRDRLLENGDLGDSDVFQNVVREAEDADSILYVNFDAGEWLDKLAQVDPTAGENLKPLQGLGLSGWEADGVGHAVFRLTTD